MPSKYRIETSASRTSQVLRTSVSVSRICIRTDEDLSFRHEEVVIGATCFAFSARALAACRSFAARMRRTYANRTTKRISILWYISGLSANLENKFLPLLNRHKDTLNKKALEDLRSDAFEKTEKALMFDDISHDFDKGFERLSLPSWRWT